MLDDIIFLIAQKPKKIVKQGGKWEEILLNEKMNLGLLGKLFQNNA